MVFDDPDHIQNVCTQKAKQEDNQFPFFYCGSYVSIPEHNNFRLRNKNKNQYVKLDILPSSHIKKYFLAIVHFGIQFV